MMSKVYIYDDKELDLSDLVRVYPASVVDLDGDVSEMSLEWTEQNEDKVKVLRYVLVFDFTPQGDDKKVKTIYNFDTREDLIVELHKVAALFS